MSRSYSVGVALQSECHIKKYQYQGQTLLLTDTLNDLQYATPNQFLSAVYDDKWYIGIIKEADSENSEFLLDFMHPNGPSSSFRWPEKRDICWVPIQHVLCRIEAPCLVTNRGQYQMTLESTQAVKKAWLNFNANP